MRAYIKIEIIMFFLIMFCSCIQDQELTINDLNRERYKKEQGESEELYVSRSMAIHVANKFFFNEGTRSIDEIVQQVFTLKDKSGNPLMYIINYQSGGFVIISAKKSYYPILAYSDESIFSFDEKIAGVEYWLQDTKKLIEESDSIDNDLKHQIEYLWRQYEVLEDDVITVTSRGSIEENNAFAKRITELRELYPGYRFYSLARCPSNGFAYGGDEIISEMRELASQYGSPLEYTIVGMKDNTQRQKVGPLLTTLWHQNSPFNDLCYKQYKAGCVAIAMAQIMKYHQYPPRFNWSNMPDETATIDTQQLISEIGIAVDMDYGKDGSGSNINKAKSAFVDKFGYHATIKDFDYDETANELLIRNNPVYMRGSDKQILFFNWDGHAWVCDGADNRDYETLYFIEYRQEYSSGYEYDSPGPPSAKQPGVAGYGQLLFHMNWGWKSGINNGWYAFNNVQVGDSNYKHNRKNLYVYPIK